MVAQWQRQWSGGLSGHSLNVYVTGCGSVAVDPSSVDVPVTHLPMTHLQSLGPDVEIVMTGPD